MFARSGDRAIGRVQVHLVVVSNITQHAHALEHVNVLAGIHNTRHVVQVLRDGIAVQIVDWVGDHDGGASRRKMYAIAADLQVVLRILRV